MKNEDHSKVSIEQNKFGFNLFKSWDVEKEICFLPSGRFHEINVLLMALSSNSDFNFVRSVLSI